MIRQDSALPRRRLATSTCWAHDDTLPQFGCKTVRELFDGLAPVYWLNHLFSLGFTSYWRKRCIATALARDPISVCDLFTGTGESLPHIRRLAGHTAHLTAVDCSPRMLDRARARGMNDIVFLCEDVRAMSIASDSVGAVTCCFGWKLLPAASAVDVVLEIDRILMPAGVFAAVELVSPSRPILRFLQRYYLSVVLALASVVSARCQLHRHLPRYIECFDGFDLVSRKFRQLGYTVSSMSMTLGFAKVVCAVKPHK